MAYEQEPEIDMIGGSWSVFHHSEIEYEHAASYNPNSDRQIYTLSEVGRNKSDDPEGPTIFTVHRQIDLREQGVRAIRVVRGKLDKVLETGDIISRMIRRNQEMIWYKEGRKVSYIIAKRDEVRIRER